MRRHQHCSGVAAQHSPVYRDHTDRLHPALSLPSFTYWSFVAVNWAWNERRTHDEDVCVWRMCESFTRFIFRLWLFLQSVQVAQTHLRAVPRSELNTARLSLCSGSTKPEAHERSWAPRWWLSTCFVQPGSPDQTLCAVWSSFDSSSGKNGSLSRCMFQSGGANYNHGGIQGVQKNPNGWKQNCCCQQGQRGLLAKHRWPCQSMSSYIGLYIYFTLLEI